MKLLAHIIAIISQACYSNR